MPWRGLGVVSSYEPLTSLTTSWTLYPLNSPCVLTSLYCDLRRIDFEHSPRLGAVLW